jgi:hypothetical protein
MSRPRRGPGLPGLLTLCLALAGAGSCGDTPVLALTLQTPEGTDPLEGVDEVRFVVSEPATDTTVSVSSAASFSLEEQISVSGAVGVITLEGYSKGTFVARGETPPMSLNARADSMDLLVSTAGALRTLRPRMPVPANDPTAVLLPGSGVLLAGGADSSKNPLSSVALYNFFTHSLGATDDLPEGRTGAVGGSCGSTCAVLGLGATGTASKTLATTLLRFDGGSWVAIADGLDPAERRREAGAATLEDGTVLVVGGAGSAGALDTALILDPGSSLAGPAFTPVSSRMTAKRTAPAVAATTGSAIVAGGQETGGAAVEIYDTSSSTFRALSLSGPTLGSGTAAAALGDGRFALLGGRDTTGALLADAWLVDPVARTATRVQGALPRARADHRAVVLGSLVVVVGGVEATGTAPRAVVLSATDLALVAQPAMQLARTGAAVGLLGQGSFVVASGVDGAGGLTDRLEVYETQAKR